MSLEYKTKEDLGFEDLVDLKILLSEMYDEILIAPKEQDILYGLRNSIGYWEEIMLNSTYHLVWVENSNEKIALSIARFPENKENFFIDYVFVKPDYRKQGIAYTMMQQQIQAAKHDHHMDKNKLLIKSKVLAPIAKTI